MKPRFLPVLLGVLLCGCASMPGAGPAPGTGPSAPAPTGPADTGAPSPSKSVSAGEFGRALDRALEGDATHLEDLAAAPQAGDWSHRSRRLLERIREQEATRREHLRELEAALTECKAARQVALKEQAALKADLQKLKRILIELETR